LRFRKGTSYGGSTVGFLNDSEKLLDVYNEDIKILEREGITRQQIVDRLKSIIGQYNHKKELISKYSVYYTEKIAEIHEKEYEMLSNDILNMRCNGGYDYYYNTVKQFLPIIIEHKYLITRMFFWGFQVCPFLGGIYSESEFCHVRNELGGGDDYWIYDIIMGKTL